jgi:hypothetical protein
MMYAVTKYLAGAAAAAAVTISAASPAQAQIFGRDRYDRGGIDAGDIITGVAVVGGIAAILGAFNRDGDRYGYDNRYRYRDNYQAAVNACGYEAERYGRGGQISITDVDRRNGNSYRVRGVIDAAYNSGYGTYGNNGRYDRYGRNGTYDSYRRSGTYDPYGRYGTYGNSRYNSYDQRVEFACTARADGRVTDFDIDRRY